jgi:hypothetical protein
MNELINDEFLLYINQLNLQDFWIKEINRIDFLF